MPEKTRYLVEYAAFLTITRETDLDLKTMQERANTFARSELMKEIVEGGDAEVMAWIRKLDTAPGLINETEEATPQTQPLDELGRKMVRLGEALQNGDSDLFELTTLANDCGLRMKFDLGTK